MGSPIHNEKIRKILARNVRGFLSMLEISENAMANKTKSKVKQKQINNITNARTGCGIDYLQEMAEIFGCEPWMLLLDDMPRDFQHHRRLGRLVHLYMNASEVDRDLIEQIAQKSAPSHAA